MVSQWIERLNNAEHQLELFEEKIAGGHGFIDKTINHILDLKEKAQQLAAEDNINAVHETYMEMSSLWRMLRGVESAIRTRYPVMCHIFDVLVYLFNLGMGNNWSVVGMVEQLVLDGWAYIQELFAKIIASRSN